MPGVVSCYTIQGPYELMGWNASETMTRFNDASDPERYSFSLKWIGRKIDMGDILVSPKAHVAIALANELNKEKERELTEFLKCFDRSFVDGVNGRLAELSNKIDEQLPNHDDVVVAHLSYTRPKKSKRNNFNVAIAKPEEHSF